MAATIGGAALRTLSIRTDVDLRQAFDGNLLCVFIRGVPTRGRGFTTILLGMTAEFTRNYFRRAGRAGIG